MTRPIRSARVVVQMTPHEKAMAERLALSTGRDLSECVRELLRSEHEQRFGRGPLQGPEAA